MSPTFLMTARPQLCPDVWGSSPALGSSGSTWAPPWPCLAGGSSPTPLTPPRLPSGSCSAPSLISQRVVRLAAPGAGLQFCEGNEHVFSSTGGLPLAQFAVAVS